MHKCVRVNKREYLDPGTIFTTARERCTRVGPRAARILFVAADIRACRREGRMYFQVVYFSPSFRYSLRQEFERLPRRIQNRILFHRGCCRRHFPEYAHEP